MGSSLLLLFQPDSRLQRDLHHLAEAGFEPMPSVEDALDRFLMELREEA